MSKRTDAAKRLLIGVPYYLLSFVISWVLMAVLVIWFIVDIAWQLALGTEGLPSSGGFASRLLDWHASNVKYVLLGQGEFQLAP